MALFALLPSLTWATDVYFYSASNSEPVKSATGVQRIELTTTGVNIVTTDGKSTAVSAADFDYVTFRKKVSDGIGSLKASSDEGIVFSLGSDVVRLASAEPFASVEVFDESGRKVAQGRAGETRAEVSLSALGNGLYVVKAVAGGKTAVKKIVKK